MDKRELVFKFFSNKDNYGKIFKSLSFFFNDPEDAKDATQEIFLRLAKNAETTSFPEDEALALKFIKKVGLNFFFESLRTKKGRELKSMSDLNSEDSVAERIPGKSSFQKLDILNGLIKKRAHLFTPRQIELWECMYNCMSVNEIMKIMKSDRQTIYSLKNKLKVAIRENIKLEEIVG